MAKDEDDQNAPQDNINQINNQEASALALDEASKQIDIIDVVQKKSYVSQFELRYMEARHAFETRNNREAIKLGSCLLQDILIDIIERKYMQLSRSSTFQQRFSSIIKEKELTGIPLQDLCSLFDDEEIKLFWHAGEDYEKYIHLLESFNFGNLAQLAEYCEQTIEGDDVTLGTQQLLCAIIALLVPHSKIMINEYYLLANFTDMTEEIKRIREEHTKLTSIESHLSYLTDIDYGITTRSFEWYKLRGMLFNKEDGNRNIAFKVDTFVDILSTIYEGTVRYLKPIDESISSDIHEIAKTLVFEAGYQSGSKFGWTMVEIFQQERVSPELEDKIRKWCAFDSDVGFGMLELMGDIARKQKEENDHRYENLSFKIKLSDNFTVYKRETWQTNHCSFIGGYIQGVCEKITGQPLKITHYPHQCEQFIPDQNYCVFKLKTNELKLCKNLEDAKMKYSHNLSPLHTDEFEDDSDEYRKMDG